MSKRKIICLILTAFMIITAAGCANTANEPSSGNTTNQPSNENTTNQPSGGDTIKIGLNYELTGAVSQYGNACSEGIELAAKEINASGGINGKQIELIKVDNKSDNNESMNVATRLATQDKVIAILGPATSGAFKATASVAESYKVPVISCSSTANDVTVQDGKVKEWVFRTCYSDNFQGSVMGSFAYSDLKTTKAVILSDKGNDYSQGLSDSFKKSFVNLSGTIVAEEYITETDTDFSPVLTKINGMDFDVLYLPTYYETAGPVIKQARAIGMDVPILGADGYDSETIVDLAGSKEALNNVYFTNHYSSQDTSPEVVKFVSDFKAAKSQEPNGFNALGYDLMYFTADAIKRAGSTDTTAIKDALASTKDFEGVTGTFSIDENHDPLKSTVVIEFKDGIQTFRAKAGV